MILFAGDCSSFTNARARACVICVECRKPRVIYSNYKLTERYQSALAVALSDFDYSCGAAVMPGSSSLRDKILVRSELRCATPIESQYYKLDSAQRDMCSYCTSGNATKPLDFTKKFRQVLPICKICLDNGKKPICSLPY